MANPTKYTRIYDYSAATLPDLRSNLNPEFSDIEAKYSDLVDALLDIRRSDGELNNEIVKPDSLHPDTTALLDTRVTEAEAARDLARQYRDTAETHRDDAQTAKDAAETAQTGAETARAGAETAETGAQSAETAAKAARDTAETRRDEARDARNEARSARDMAESHASDSATYAASAYDSAEAADASAKAAAEAASLAPNEDAITVFVNGRDFGSITESSPFSNEEVPSVRVDLAKGAATIDLGAV